MSTLIIQLVILTICVGALLMSYWNYSRYVEAKQDQEKSSQNLRIALHAMNDAGIGGAEFKRIESSHYRPYQKRFRVSLLVGISFGIAGLALLLA
ncbi:hypothetical protein [Pseudomonas sp. RIT-PI-o]|uniref:hypothetical protein n=1 Tax=Pseudomonas sp. RIT-PI-o TaxID=1690246 RepID=UPI0006CD361B|nr:hypothetical protein [Pseudomonas sp. RIT-PI-o]KPG82222.1 hypothetical protein AEQ63_13550 [Pseudomonas sp. RIT-PI-o]